MPETPPQQPYVSTPPRTPTPPPAQSPPPGRVRSGRVRRDLRPPEAADGEKTTLLTFLDYLREALVRKVEGVPDQDAKAPAVPSGTSLLGLVKHLTAVEFNWFVWAYEGAELPLHDDKSAPTADEGGPELIAAYRAAVARANTVVAACDDLGRPGARSLRETAAPSMRWVLAHMIEETGRHAGHADILRELYDGSVGR